MTLLDHATKLWDKRHPDPTRTATLRAAFRAAAELRLRQLRSMLRAAVIDHDMLALSYVPQFVNFIGPAARLQQFSGWFEGESRLLLSDPWFIEYLNKAVYSGGAKAVQELGLSAQMSPDAMQNLYELAYRELVGIAAALSQNIIRDAERALRVRPAPAEAFALMAKTFDRIAKVRLHAFANYMVVRGYNHAKLEVYRANNIDMVGVQAEQPQHSYLNRYQPGFVTLDAFSPDEVKLSFLRQEATSDSRLLDAGEGPGHEFRGNQYQEGESGGGGKAPQAPHNPTKQMIETWERANQGEAESASRFNEIPIEQVPDYMKRNVQELMRNTEPMMWMSSSSFGKVLKSGKFLNQHETGGTSQGRGVVQDPAYRRAAEESFHQVSGLSAEDMPKYGFLAERGKPVLARRNPYGNITIAFKDKVRNQTTFSAGDSLNNSWKGVIPSRLDNPDWRSLGPGNYRTFSEEKDITSKLRAINAGYGFIEAQMWGKLSAADIKTVYFNKVADYERFAPRLSQLGVEAKLTNLNKVKDNVQIQAAGVLFVTPSGYGLFCKRTDTGEWALPAGELEDGETAQEAAQREAAEEVGYPGDWQLTPIDRKVNRGVDFTAFLQPVATAFDPPFMNEELSSYLWRPLADPPRPLHPGLAQTLALVSKQQDSRRVRDDDDDDDIVGVRTAGDDLVCQLCEEIADDSPYNIDEAMDLIPAHANCRCGVFPWFDRRFSHDSLRDAGEGPGHEFRGNQYTSGESGGGGIPPEPSRTIRGHMEEYNRLAASGRALGKRVPALTNLRVSNEQAAARVANLRQRLVNFHVRRTSPTLTPEQARALVAANAEYHGARVATSTEGLGSIQSRIMQAVNVQNPEHLGSGATSRAVSLGRISEAEAREYAAHRGWEYVPPGPTSPRALAPGVSPRPPAVTQPITPTTTETQIHPRISLEQQHGLLRNGWTPAQIKTIGRLWSAEHLQGLFGGMSEALRTEIAAIPAPASVTTVTASGKKKYNNDDFQKANITGLLGLTKQAQDKFFEDYSEKIGEPPEHFKTAFVGGLNATMKIDPQVDRWTISGNILDHDGAEIGEYQRQINWKDNYAYSSLFRLNHNVEDKGIGKQMLAANVAMYQKLGLSKVKVSANIGVGGYAWARYGYVPIQVSWDNLRGNFSLNLHGGLMNDLKIEKQATETEIRRLRQITNSSDPKSLWDLADTRFGKKLLLGTNWSGVLDFHDKDAMARFTAYVSKKSKPQSVPKPSVVVYHGTTLSALSSIAQHGLTADTSRRNFESGEYGGDRANSVFVSSERGEAQGWVGLRERNIPLASDHKVVLRIEVPAEHANRLEKDEMRPDGTSFRIARGAPREWISGYSEQDPVTYSWSDFKPLPA